MNVTGGQADVTTNFVLRTAADGTATTGATITSIDLQYCRAGAAPAAKVDAIELATIDGSHEANKAKEVDGTDQPGLYRVDWPDAAFAAGVTHVVLSVKLAGSFTEHLSVEIDAPVNMTKISGDSVAADNLESQYDTAGLTGDNFPANQAQLANFSTGTGQASVNAAGAVVTLGSETNTFADTSEAGVIHIVTAAGGNTDFYYEFDLSEFAGVGDEILWTGYVQANNDTADVEYFEWSSSTWKTLVTLNGANGTTLINRAIDFPIGATGVGANFGLVRIRFISSSTTNIGTDRIRCVFSQINSGITNGSTITLTESEVNSNFVGENWNLVLNGQDISGSYIHGAKVTGVASGSTDVTFENCDIGAATIPPGEFRKCGFGKDAGAFTAASAGEYVFKDCFSHRAGDAQPAFNFSGLGGPTGINNRGWFGGANYTLDSDCMLSHEVAEGGLTIITTGGANVEVRGMPRALTFVLSGAGVIQAIVNTGPITISGTATSVVILHGQSTSLADTSVGTTVTDNTVTQAKADALIAGLNDVSTAQVNEECDQALTDYGANTVVPDAAGTAAILQAATNALITALENLSAAQVNTEVDTALADYDGPTKSEMDVAHALLATVAALLAHDTDIKAEVGGLNGEAMRGTDSASTHSAADVVNTLMAKTGITAGGTASFEGMMKIIYAMARGKFTKDGDTYTFFDDDDTTELFTLTITATERTTA